MAPKRTSRAWQPTPKTEAGSPEETKVPPPSVHLMEHLWDKFGERPGLDACDGQTGASVEVHAIALLAAQAGREQVMNYLDELLHGDQK